MSCQVGGNFQSLTRSGPPQLRLQSEALVDSLSTVLSAESRSTWPSDPPIPLKDAPYVYVGKCRSARFATESFTCRIVNRHNQRIQKLGDFKGLLDLGREIKSEKAFLPYIM